MIVGEVRCLFTSGGAQGGRDRAPCRREKAPVTRTSACCAVGAVNPASSGPIQASRRGVGSDAPSMTALLGSPILLGTTRQFVAPGAVMTRDQILQRYRHLRMISTGHHSGALKFLSRQALLEHA